MNRVLRKRLPRFFIRNFGSYFGMALFIVLLVCFCVAYMVSYRSTLASYDNMVDANRLENGEFTLFMKADYDELCDELKSDIKIEEQFYTDIEFETKKSKKDDDKDDDDDDEDDEDETVTLRLFRPRKDINREIVFEGSLPEAEDEIAFDKLFAEANDIQLNDRIRINGKRMWVTGIIGLPDYVVSLKNTGDLLADRNTFGVAVVNDDYMDKIDEKDLVWNYSYWYRNVYEDDELNERNKTLIEDLSEDHIISSFCPIEDNTRVNGVTSKVETNLQSSMYFIILGMIIVAFLFAIVSIHTFEEECSFVGVLIATGFRKISILIHYITIPFVVTLISSAAGFALGTTVLYEIPAKSIYEYDNLPELEFTIEPKVYVLGLAVPILAVVIINLIVFCSKLNLTPLKLIRKDIRKESKDGKAHSLKFLDFISRFRLRTVLRNKGKYISLVFGVFLSGWLIMFGLGMNSSFDVYIDTLPDSAVSDYQYVLKTPLPDDSVLDKYVERDTISSYETEYSGRMLGVNVLGICEDSDYFSEIDTDRLNRRSIIISDVMAEKLGLKIGDRITLDNKLTLHSWDVKIVDIVDFKLGVYAFTKQDILNDFLEKEEGYYNALFSDEEIEDIDDMYISNTITRDKVADSAEQMKELMASLIVILVIVGVVCYVIVMYLLTKIVIDKNALNISLLKVFGYRNPEVNKLYLSQAEIIIVVSIILCLPLQYKLMCKMWPSMLSSMSGFFYFKVSVPVIASIIAIGVITCLITNMMHMKHVRKIAMTEALKNRE